MYKLRLGLLAILSVSALNAANEGGRKEFSINGRDNIESSRRSRDGKENQLNLFTIAYRLPTLTLLAAKLAADNYSLIDGLPEGVKDNCVVNTIADTSIAKFLSPLVAKQDVDRVIYTAALDYALQNLRGNGINKQVIAKRAAAVYLISMGSRAVHALANHYGFERYVETSSQVVNNIAYGLVVHNGLGLYFGSK